MVRPKMGSQLPLRESLTPQQRLVKSQKTLEKKRAYDRAWREKWRRRQGMKAWGSEREIALERKKEKTMLRVRRHREAQRVLAQRLMKILFSK